MKQGAIVTRTLSAIALCLLFSPAVAAQQPSSWSGKYEGTAKSPDGDVRLTLELVDEANGLTGTATTARGTYKTAKSKLADGVLTLDFEQPSAAKLSLHQKDGLLVGELVVEGKTGAVELKKVVKDELSGEWDAAADVQGQAFPFTLSLKLDGEKVTGSSNSQLGNSQISTGTFKDGRLALVLDSGSGPIGLVAALDGGKLIGDFDYAGQMQGKWVAVRKK